MIASSIKTAILVEDTDDFRKFLIAKGFQNFNLVDHESKVVYKVATLSIYFDNAAEIMKYKLQDVEGQFMALKKSNYFYDMDDFWDMDQARDFFGDNDY